MLASQDRGEVGELAGLLEAREQEVLLELLVIILDDAPDDTGARGERVERDLTPRVEPQTRFVVQVHDAAEHAVLAHQVFRGRNFFVALPGRGVLPAMRGSGTASEQDTGT